LDQIKCNYTGIVCIFLFLNVTVQAYFAIGFFLQLRVLRGYSKFLRI